MEVKTIIWYANLKKLIDALYKEEKLEELMESIHISRTSGYPYYDDYYSVVVTSEDNAFVQRIVEVLQKDPDYGEITTE